MPKGALTAQEQGVLFQNRRFKIPTRLSTLLYALTIGITFLAGNVCFGQTGKTKGGENAPGPELYPAARMTRKAWGFINESGEYVIKPQFSYVYKFHEGLALFSKIFTRGHEVLVRKGYVDKNGEVVIPPQFRLAKSFSEGFAAVEIDGKWGYIDKKGNVAIRPDFDMANSFTGGLAAVMAEDGKWDYINTSGLVTIKSKFDSAEKFSDGLALVQKGELWGFIDKKGSMAIPLKFDFANSFSEGLASVEIDGKWGFIDKNGKTVVEPQYRIADSLREGLALVGNGKYGYLDKNGKEVIPLKFLGAHPFSSGLAMVKFPDGPVGYINRKGEVHFKLTWGGKRYVKYMAKVTDFSGNLAMGHVFVGIYYFNKKGEVVFLSSSRNKLGTGSKPKKGKEPIKFEWPSIK